MHTVEGRVAAVRSRTRRLGQVRNRAFAALACLVALPLVGFVGRFVVEGPACLPCLMGVFSEPLPSSGRAPVEVRARGPGHRSGGRAGDDGLREATKNEWKKGDSTNKDNGKEV